MTPQRLCVTLTTLLLLGACSSTGVDVSSAQTSQFVVGRTTLPEVEAKLGPPTGDQTGSNGLRTLAYRGEHNKSDPVAFLPIASFFSYGSKTRVHEVDLVFGPDQILRSTRIDDHQS